MRHCFKNFGEKDSPYTAWTNDTFMSLPKDTKDDFARTDNHMAVSHICHSPHHSICVLVEVQLNAAMRQAIIKSAEVCDELIVVGGLTSPPLEQDPKYT